ncbi:MAG: PLP-dependent aminotransferase family protein [Burkholderiaceae bacterium]|nr:PLP-dependent aminotransferase family protein [Burkholderiaceae bacterium]
MPNPPRYQQLAQHYQQAIEGGALGVGDKLPSLRTLMRLHGVGLSTALQTCRTLEEGGWVQGRERSGYFVRRPSRMGGMPPPDAPALQRLPDPAQFVGIHEKVSAFVARRQQGGLRLDLSVAHCVPALYPGDALRAAMARSLRQQPELLTAPPPQDCLPFGTAVARRALRAGMQLTPLDVLPTHGCTEALHLALRAVAHPGDTVAVESPAFYGLLQILESLGLRALEVPTHARTGLSVEALELALSAYERIRAVVVVPHLQNPLGSVMPDAHKAPLVRLCSAHGVAVIEDDCYSELFDDGSAPRALQSFDQDGSVIHCASLHKALAPGLRLGWMHGGRWHARVQMLKQAHSRSNAALPLWAVGGFMASGAYERHLQRLRLALRVQRERSADCIAAHFPPGTHIARPAGGVQLWVELPKPLPAQLVFEAALREGILVAPGALFSHSGRFDHCLRINCGQPWTESLEDGLRRLGTIATQAWAGTG